MFIWVKRERDLEKCEKIANIFNYSYQIIWMQDYFLFTLRWTKCIYLHVVISLKVNSEHVIIMTMNFMNIHKKALNITIIVISMLHMVVLQIITKYIQVDNTLITKIVYNNMYKYCYYKSMFLHINITAIYRHIYLSTVFLVFLKKYHVSQLILQIHS